MAGMLSIVSSPRSGSNYLCDLLNSHSRIACYGELFHPDEVPVHFRRKFFWRERPFSIAYREAKPDAFFKSVMNMTMKKSPNLLMVGSKLLLNDYQVNSGLDAISSICNKVILLSRENKLAWYSSLKIATETGIWVTDKVVAAKQKKIIFDASEYELYLTNQTRLLAQVKNRLKHYSLEPYILTYEAIVEADAINNVFSYLDLPMEPLKTKLLKQNTSNIIERFENAEFVYQYAKNNNLLHWVT